MTPPRDPLGAAGGTQLLASPVAGPDDARAPDTSVLDAPRAADAPPVLPPRTARRADAVWMPDAGLRLRWRDARERVMLRTCDAILTAHLQVAASKAREGRRSNFGRIQLVARSAQVIVPVAMGWIRRRLRRHRFLPFADPVADVLGFGSGVTVFRLQRRDAAQGGDLVLKVYRRTLGKPLPVLLSHAYVFRARYRLVRSWYAGTSVVLPTTFLALQGPLLGQPAVAAVQPYLDGEKWDLFERAAEAGFAAFVRAHPPLEAALRLFVERTLAVLDAEQRCLDIIGRNNVLVVRQGDRARLHVIDCGVFDLTAERASAPHRVAALSDRIARLRRLYEEVFGRAPDDARPQPEEAASWRP